MRFFHVSRLYRRWFQLLPAALMLIALPHSARPAQRIDAPRYDMGSPSLTDLWVDPIRGSDQNSGAARDQALQTLDEAWRRTAHGTPPTAGWRIMLAAGTYPASSLPAFMESRYGTFDHPILIKSADGRGAAVLQGQLNVYDCRYLYLVDLTIAPVPAGDTLHLEKCDHILARGLRLDGGTFISESDDRPVAYDNFKINQSQHIYVEDSDVSGAMDNAIDAVAVQYGHFVDNRIHNSRDWCMYLKGGSAYCIVEGNEFFDGGTGGLTFGQGTGFQFMTDPWLQYEAYDMKAINNVIHDTGGAGLGVQGGYNVLLAYNTLYRVGQRDHMVEFVAGLRSCDGQPGDPGRDQCDEYLKAGGWGTTLVDDGTNEVRIPNKHVYFYNNLLVNPSDYPRPGQVFTIFGPYSDAPQHGSGVPTPTRFDEDLQIKGNLVWSGPDPILLGVEDPDQGCQPGNPTCNEAQIRADNAFSAAEPAFIDPANGDYRPQTGGAAFGVRTFAIPSFPGGDRPTPAIPEGDLTNAVTRDRAGAPRNGDDASGAYAGVPQDSPAWKVGDVNGDGQVDIRDATLALRDVVGISPLSSEGERAGDVNGDGRVTIADVTLILQQAISGGG